MIRVACALAILALVTLLGMVFQTSGGTATLYVFVGIPALGAAVVVYLFAEGVHVRRLLADWLGGGSGLVALAVGLAVVSGAPAQAEPGAGAYGRLCASCHGALGQGDTPAGRAMQVPAFAAPGPEAEHLLRIVREQPSHKAVSRQLDDDTLRAIAEHLRALLSPAG